MTSNVTQPPRDYPTGNGNLVKKRLTVTFQDIQVEVRGLGEDYGSTCTSVLSDLLPWFKSRGSRRNILEGISGQVCPGEMLLVLGRPESGCTSLLKIISNQRDEFQSVRGEVCYGQAGWKEAKDLRDQIVMNTEEDLHFPNLKVSETLDFAAETKLPKTLPGHHKDKHGYVRDTRNRITTDLAIGHAKDTLVGNEFVRGVSGGERKRVSLAEVLATRAPLQCWDNSTRGLDASNALDFVRVLRKSADEEERSIVATLYQAGNGIFNLFDKVLVLAEGREIFYGPTRDARQYFEDMGFQCIPGANIADFLTSVAVHTERSVREGFEATVPNTPAEFEARYRDSTVYRAMMSEMATGSAMSLEHEIDGLRSARRSEKSRTLSILSREASPYIRSFTSQTLACTKRQVQIIWGDRWSVVLKIASAIIMSLVTGSLLYDLSENTDSLFMRTGALFFPILFFGLNAMSETTASFMGRPIISRHKRFAFYRPASYAMSCVITDIPLVVIIFSIFQIVFYFMVNFQHDAGNFFTLWFVYIITTLCFTSFYRMIGAWCRHFGLASQISGWCTMVMMVYTGYLIPQTSMHPWFRWIVYLNPASYCFDAVMGSELGNRVIDCVDPQVVPYGADYNNSAYQSCTVAGSRVGLLEIAGESYLESQFGISIHTIWRNAGILIAFWIFFSIMTAIGFELNLTTGSGSTVLFDRRQRRQELALLQDPEKAHGTLGKAQQKPSLGSDTESSDGKLSEQGTTFTFKDISYFVHHQGKEKQLLCDISGFVKPGQLVALMGSSGAGKTTLMDVLAQRKDSGRVEGSIMVNGRPQGISFQRTTGYCEQNDVHEPTATVREALMFSARLRQNHSIPDSDKERHVEFIMDLLELTPLQHAIVGSPGSGLSIEQRKRLTLATELAAKPSLLFLDEPTSGLDGQSAYEICRFMGKLAKSGQTIICTIHQPSAALFETFDVLLLLAKGGRTTYFGETGRKSAKVLDYFGQRGATCPPDANPAEHIVDVVQGRFGSNIDWPQQWLDSEERQQLMRELEELNAVPQQQQQQATAMDTTNSCHEDTKDFAAPILYQIMLVTQRQLMSLWRNPDYIWNKIGLHVSNALFGGFTFWKIGNGSFDLQLRLMAVFNFVFVAPGCINQLQPLFIRNRDIFETREKKSKTYHWLAFIAAQLVSEIPVLVICGTVYFCCWYFTAGFPVEASLSGQVYLQMLLYEFLYTSIGQAIAAYSPNEYFAALANPIIIGAALINFCGVVVPYSYIPTFWRYWMYWLDPFTYLVGGLLEPLVWSVPVHCTESELANIPLPSNTTCGEYLAEFFQYSPGYVVDPTDTASCSYCSFSTGADYLRTMNINEAYYGWRNVGITALFCISSYALVFLMMKLRSKATKTAS